LLNGVNSSVPVASSYGCLSVVLVNGWSSFYRVFCQPDEQLSVGY